MSGERGEWWGTMKRVRAALCALAILVPATAWAESWVLWSRTGFAGEPRAWRVEDTYEPFLSQRACHTEARDVVRYLAQRRRAEHQKVSVSGDGFSLQFEPPTSTGRGAAPPMVIQYRCWPAGDAPR